VVVPGITDDPVDLERLGYFIGEFLNIKALDLLPYHNMGVVKYQNLGLDYKLKDTKPMDKNLIPELRKNVLRGIKKRRLELGLL
jgi:pyruvate formate lyase activating enzyme